jgi:hypothetical protein
VPSATLRSTQPHFRHCMRDAAVMIEDGTRTQSGSELVPEIRSRPWPASLSSGLAPNIGRMELSIFSLYSWRVLGLRPIRSEWASRSSRRYSRVDLVPPRVFTALDSGH